ncbi:MAG: hypothetical protein L6R36_004647 [Xanthoria steineri]|nr:MAG: hypothetical protein L6R36_004647 [Xanthoria steineri]
MADGSPQLHSDSLAPPRKSVELEDPGAHELSSDNEEDVFSDAQEDAKARSGKSSPIPTTRVEKVDDRESHGEVPGTDAYNRRRQDAVPDELEVVGDTSKPSSRRTSQSRPERTSTPGGTPIPKTVVEKIDPDTPSHGDIPGTEAFNMRQADAVPDVILQSPNAKSSFPDNVLDTSAHQGVSVPRTMVTRVDEEPSHGEVPGTEAYDMRAGDAKPDVVETKEDPASLPTSSSHRSSLPSPKPRPSAIRRDSPIAADGGFGPMPSSDDDASDGASSDGQEPHHTIAGEGLGDDFDDFEAQGDDDDFGDFDDGFEQSSTVPEPAAPELPSVPKSPFPVLSFDAFTSINNLSEAIEPHLQSLFPNTTSSSPASHRQPTGSPPSLFLTPRSQSLFTQLIASPPLSPPNWLRSQTRRLFLVSLGVPIDLDEILPKSKQKKLVLPSTIRTNSEHRRSESRRRRRDGMKGLKDANASTTSISSQSKDTKDRDRRKRKGGNDQLPPHPPPLDFSTIRHLCSTTETALHNMTETELKAHVQKLEEMTRKAGEVLEYWVKRRDAATGEKEMFESVIGDLVKHARRVRR